MSDEDYRALQEVLLTRPDAADLIKGSGGLRKIRWSLEGRGKSGCVRAIYYWVVRHDQIYSRTFIPKLSRTTCPRIN